MSGEDDGEMGFQHRGGAPPFFGSGWDPIVSLSQTENFGTSSMAPQSGFSNFVHYHSGPGLGGNFSEMATSFGLPECAQIGRGPCPPNYPPNKEGGTQRTPTNAPHTQDDGASPNAKKKRRSPESNSPFNSDKNGEGEQQKDLSGDSSEYIKGHNDKKQKIELKGKNAKDKDAGEVPKENYIHMRAKRGQATNSHSLAERVRRERISERMKLLQELVPGCNKITGKAVMLDEIINYVQSLQQQVEFLSMKLATVNPELNNIDLERILSKDILPSRGSNASILGYGPGLSSPHPYPCVVPQGNFPGIPNTSLPFNPMPQPVWDSELQSLLQMEFDSNPAINNLGPNARSKLEL